MRFHRFDAPGRVKLDRISTEPPDGVTKQEAKARFEELNEELFGLQDLMWGARTHSVLMVLQGRDAAGKDGVRLVNDLVKLDEAIDGKRDDVAEGEEVEQLAEPPYLAEVQRPPPRPGADAGDRWGRRGGRTAGRRRWRAVGEAAR